jgi:hypothetical protein
VVNWTWYNESLVRRGEVILDFDVIDSWHSELERMNDGKKGAQYNYPDSFVQLLGYVRTYFHLPYRQTEGVVIAHMLIIRYHLYQTIVQLVGVSIN